MKIELNYYEITFYGLLIINLFNWLDGVLTYIALYIVPKGEFYENNPYVWNMFNSVGLFNSFIYKVSYCLALTLFFVLIINKGHILNIFKSDKPKLIFHNIFMIYLFMIMALFINLTFSNSWYLILYYL